MGLPLSKGCIMEPWKVEAAEAVQYVDQNPPGQTDHSHPGAWSDRSHPPWGAVGLWTPCLLPEGMKRGEIHHISLPNGL